MAYKFPDFSCPQWEFKFGDIEYSKIYKRNFLFLFKYQTNLYQKIYEIFIRQIKTYADYSDQFKFSKNETAELIRNWIEGKKILSWGCGTAYIEEMHFPNEDITLMDNAKIYEYSKRKVNSENILKTWRGNCIICMGVVSHMNKSEIDQLFFKSSVLLDNNGILLLSHTPRAGLLGSFLYILKTFIKFLLHANRTYVLWGWRRSNEYYELIASKYNLYKIEKIQKSSNNEDIIVFRKFN